MLFVLLSCALYGLALGQDACGEVTWPPVWYPDSARAETYSDKFIIEGKNARPEWFPWQIALEVLGEGGLYYHHCSAVLIREDWALTAARCIWDDSETYSAVIGLYNRTDDDEYRQTVDIRRPDIYVHEDFDIENPTENDIALFRISPVANVSAPNINTICLPPFEDRIYEDNPNCLYSGWGDREEDANEPQDVLQQAASEVLRNDDCELWYLGAGYLDSEHICGHDEADFETASCDGDEGGPLQCLMDARFELVGISSFRDLRLCDPFFPTIYTRVTSYLGWIRDHIDG